MPLIITTGTYKGQPLPKSYQTCKKRLFDLRVWAKTYYSFFGVSTFKEARLEKGGEWWAGWAEPSQLWYYEWG